MAELTADPAARAASPSIPENPALSPDESQTAASDAPAPQAEAPVTTITLPQESGTDVAAPDTPVQAQPAPDVSASPADAIAASGSIEPDVPTGMIQAVADGAASTVETTTDAARDLTGTAIHAAQETGEAAISATADVSAQAAQAGGAMAGTAAESVPPLVEALSTPAAQAAEAGLHGARAGLDGAARLGGDALRTGEALRQAMTESAAAATRGLFEINGKLAEIVRASNEAQVALWQSTFTAGSVPEAVQVQAEALRRSYEMTAERWRDLAQTTTRVMGETLQPLQALQPTLAAWTPKAKAR